MKEEGKRTTAGKWKRLARQKGKELEEGPMIKTGNSTTSGHKRGWLMLGAEIDKLQGLGHDKRQKEQNQENVINTIQVEEVSLNWPQLGQ